MPTKLSMIVIQIISIVLEITILSLLSYSLKGTNLTKNKFYIIFHIIGWPTVFFGALIAWKNKCPFLTTYTVVETALFAIFFTLLYDI